MRYLPFMLWAATTIVFIVMAFSRFLFDRTGIKRFASSVLLALVWPIAILSPGGRALLLNYGRKP